MRIKIAVVLRDLRIKLTPGLNLGTSFALNLNSVLIPLFLNVFQDLLDEHQIKSKFPDVCNLKSCYSSDTNFVDGY